MNSTSLDKLRGGPARQPQDERMEQIRDLLVGDVIRATEIRIAALEARIKELEADVGRQIDALAARLEALSAETGAGQRTAFDGLAQSIVELGERVRRIARE
ncbi:MAG: hypothetical protein AB1749_05350 [Pseudomonadota bacterium]